MARKKSKELNKIIIKNEPLWKQILWSLGTVIAIILAIIQLVTILNNNPQIDLDVYQANGKVILFPFNEGEQTARILNYSLCKIDSQNRDRCIEKEYTGILTNFEIKEKESKPINTNLTIDFLENNILNENKEWQIKICEKRIGCSKFIEGLPREEEAIIVEPKADFTVSIIPTFYDKNGNKIDYP